MLILHQPVHHIADQRRRPIPFVRQLGGGIGRRDMRLVRALLPPKRDRRVAGILIQ